MTILPSHHDVTELRAYFAQPVFLSEVLSLPFTTEESFVHEVLPPCLQPPESPTGLVLFGRWQTRAAGSFSGFSVYLDALHKGQPGVFPIATYFSSPCAVAWGRDIWGEGIKLADVGVYGQGPTKWAVVQRNGTSIAELTCEVGSDVGGVCGVGRSYELRLAIDNLDGNIESASLHGIDETYEIATQRPGTGQIVLRSTPFDPVGDIPILTQGAVTYTEGRSTYRRVMKQSLAPDERYLKHAYSARYWDDPRQLPRPHILL